MRNSGTVIYDPLVQYSASHPERPDTGCILQKMNVLPVVNVRRYAPLPLFLPLRMKKEEIRIMNALCADNALMSVL